MLRSVIDLAPFIQLFQGFSVYSSKNRELEWFNGESSDPITYQIENKLDLVKCYWSLEDMGDSIVRLKI